MTIPKSASFINAFQLIAMSNDLDLSGLFVEEASTRLKHWFILYKFALLIVSYGESLLDLGWQTENNAWFQAYIQRNYKENRSCSNRCEPFSTKNEQLQGAITLILHRSHSPMPKVLNKKWHFFSYRIRLKCIQNRRWLEVLSHILTYQQR